VTVTNTGPACTGPPPVPCAVSASAFSGPGSYVWSSEASPSGTRQPSCSGIQAETVPSGWSSSTTIYWNQDYCNGYSGVSAGSPNPQCPQTQVMAGNYQITGSVYSSGS